MGNLILSLTLCALALTGCYKAKPLPPVKPPALISAGGTTSSGSLAVSHGKLVVNKGQAGVAFAWISTPNRSKELAYFLLFTHDYPQVRAGTSSAITESFVRTTQNFTAFGAPYNTEYRATRAAGSQNIDSEAMTLAGSTFDLAEGKVFLIDMNPNSTKVMQRDIALPAVQSNLEDPEITEWFAESTLQKLRDADATVDEFCKQIEEGTQ